MLELITKESESGDKKATVGATLDELARAGAQRMIEAALRVEVDDYLARYRGERDAAGHAVVVRNGTARPRPVLTGVGPVTIAAPRVNDRRAVAGVRQKFASAILPPYVRRSPRVESVLPLLYLHGLSTGDFREALPAMLGPTPTSGVGSIPIEAKAPTQLSQIVVAFCNAHHEPTQATTLTSSASSTNATIHAEDVVSADIGKADVEQILLQSSRSDARCADIRSSLYRDVAAG